MLKALINKLENPKRPLLNPNVLALKFWGLLLPKNAFRKFFYLVMHLTVTLFIGTLYADIWLIRSDVNLVLNNLKLAMLGTITVAKVASFLIRQKDWRSIIEYVTKADLLQRTTSDVEKNDIITKYTKYCRIFTYLYWSFVVTSDAMPYFQPFKYFLSPNYRENVRNGTEQYLQVVSSWVPFNKQNMVGYLAALTIQIYAAICGGGWLLSFDSNAIVLMVFFRGEIQLLRKDSANIFGSEKKPVNKDVGRDRLKECHRRYVELLKYVQLFNSLLSPIMLLYMLVCSIMLCFTAYQMTIAISTTERFLASVYLTFCVAQLFMYCWHSNDILYESHDLILGPYESIWWTIDAKRCKDLYILMVLFNRIVVFTAGSFFELTLPTFISIIKGAYSCYTLLCQLQMK